MSARNVSSTDVYMIHRIAREGREAIRRGDYALIDGDDAREALFRRTIDRAEAQPARVRRKLG